MNEKVYFIYQTICDVNGKKYIGLHYGLTTDDYLGSGKVLNQAIEKYGREHFYREILEICPDKESAEIRERYYTDLVQAESNPEYYNLIPGGGQPPHYSGTKHPNYGKSLSEEIKQKISQKLTGRKLPEEVKLKMSKSRMGENNPFYGKHMTEETKAKLSESKGYCIEIQNAETGETFTFTSLTRCLEFMGLTRGAMPSLKKHYQNNETYYGYDILSIEEKENNRWKK